MFIQYPNEREIENVLEATEKKKEPKKRLTLKTNMLPNVLTP